MRAARNARVARRAPILCALVAVLTFASASPAAAHDGLLSSAPAAGSTVTDELGSIDLAFSDDFFQLGEYNPAFAIHVTGPDGRFYNTDCVLLDGSRMSTPTVLGESGQYGVLWQVVSSDGHPTSGSFDFTYVRPDSVQAAGGSSTGATCPNDPAAEVNQIPQPSATPPPPDNGDAQVEKPNQPDARAGTSILPAVIVGVALTLLAASGVLFARWFRRRKPR